MDHHVVDHVAVGIICNDKDEVLIALRPATSHQGGLWEFPGGRLQPDEDARHALYRELNEELNITVSSAHPLLQVTHDYPDRSVLLDVWRVGRFTGVASGHEGQSIRWQPRTALQASRFPPANGLIIRTLQLPPEIAITRQAGSLPRLLTELELLIARQVPAIQLRQPQLDWSEYRHWYRQALSICRCHDVLLFANTSPQWFGKLDGPALHLNSRQLLQQSTRPAGDTPIISASCHDLLQLQHAAAIGVDLVLLSPVLPSTSHPVAGAMLGWQGFQALADQVSLPVYALGGVGRQQLGLARSYGAHGIAGISAFV